MDGPGHLLSLKVMRVSRPELASMWQPFYSSSPSFSAHSTASIVSLQGNAPLPCHPKTLRDLTHASEFLTLPSSFGSIQLGETFSSCLCVNNEAEVDIEAVSMKVEMQTANAKVILAEFGGSEYKLAAGDAFEYLVNHEIKELGQHVLACSVIYRPPSNVRQSLGGTENPNDIGLQTFRKFYKFTVTNPLSVKTKVHTPRSPSALFSPSERDKILLEVHIQNLHQEPIHFERMRFECAEGWDVQDTNTIDAGGKEDEERKQLFSGSLALMQPQDIRQYIYTLSPKSLSLLPMRHAPGNIVPLGRLDIFWRSSFGEPGRLLTSMLSRKIPIPPIPVQQHPASALPSYLKRGTPGTSPSRPQSPQPINSRPGSPSWDQSLSRVPVRPQSPFQALMGPIPDIEVNLVIREVSRHPIRVEEPFNISFTLLLSPSTSSKREYRRGVMTLAVQHLQALKVKATSVPPTGAFSPRFPSSGLSTPASTAPAFNYDLAHSKLLIASSQHHLSDDLDQDQETTRSVRDAISLPPPSFNNSDELKTSSSTGVVFVGSSVLFLPAVEFPVLRATNHSQTSDQTQEIAMQEFELTYLPLRKGYNTIGGLRVILIEDKLTEEGENLRHFPHDENHVEHRQVRVLKEWPIISEVWVSP